MRRRNEHQKSKRLRNRRRIAAVLTLSMMMSGFQGASLPVFAEESAETVVEGGEDRIRLRLDAAALRAAAENAVQSGSSISLGGSIFAGSGLRDSYEGYFTDAHTLYELSLDEIDAELPAELSAREAGLRVFIEPNPHGAAFTEDTTVALYAPDGMLAELLRGGDIYNGTEAPRFESTGEADYTLSGRARLTFLYQNDGEKAKTFTLEVGERKLDTVKVKPARKLMPGVLSAVEKNIREELETETRAPETSTEQTTAAESAESTVEESRAAETAEPEETAAENPEAGNPGGENPEAETETAAEAAAENTETGAPAEAESEEAKTEASETSAEGIAAGLATASLRPVEGFGILIRRAVRHIFTLGVIEARAEEQDGAAEITETEAAVPETAAAETEAQIAEPEKETAAAPENSGEESAAESTPETGTEQPPAAAGTAIAETGSPETAGTSAAAPLPDTDMGERRAALEQLRQADAREYLAAIVMQQYGASKLFRDVENERKLTVRYRAQLGGTVSRAEETVDVLAEDAAFLGATAEANQKYYSFDGWENTAGEIVSTEPTLIPELDEIKTNTTFTARFVRNVEMPAFRKTWTGDRLIVTVDVPENTFPKGTELRAQEVGEEAAREIVQAAAGSEQEISRAVAVDLSFFYEGQELQPENGNEVRVTMTLSGDRRMDDPIVVHQHDGEAAEAITDTAEITRNSRTQTLEFSAEKFSIYGIGDAKPVMTYRFHDADGRLLEASYTDAGGNSIRLTEQRVKKGDTVYAPQSPEKENHVFLGWSTTQGKTALDISADELRGDRAAFCRFTITTEITKDNAGEVDYYPVFAERFHVIFMNGTGNDAKVLEGKDGKSGDEIKLMQDGISVVSVPLPLTKAVVGWSESREDDAKPIGDSLTLTKDTVLYPIVREGCYITFDENGGSYTAPQFVPNGMKSVEPTSPVRTGYTFTGWTKTKDGYDFYTFGGGLTEGVRLYARWKASTTSYNIVIWKQRVTDAKDAEKTYDYDRTIEQTGITTGSSAYSSFTGESAVVKDAKGSKKIEQDRGFHWNTARITKLEAIKGDGTDVLNLYLDRDLLTIEFYRKKSLKWKKVQEYTGLYNSLFSDPTNGYTWPGESNWRYKEKDGSKMRLTYLAMFNFDDLNIEGNTLKLYKTNSGDAEIRHFLQGEDGVSYPLTTPYTASGDWWGDYYLNNKFGGGYEFDYYIDREGGEEHKITTDRDQNGNVISYTPAWVTVQNGLSFYYKRREFRLDFKDGTGVKHSEPVKYGTKLTGKGGHDFLTAPEGMKFGYWAVNNENGTEFDFTTGTMPAHNLALYAHWEPITCTVTVKGMQGDDEVNPAEGVALPFDYGAPAQELKNRLKVKSGTEKTIFGEEDAGETLTVREGMTWLGWTVEENGVQKPYSLDSKVKQDLVLYAKYSNENVYTLTYDLLGNAKDREDLYDSDAFLAQGMDADGDGTGDGIYIPETKFAYGGRAVLESAARIEVKPIVKRTENGEPAGGKELQFLGWTLNDPGSAGAELLQPNDTIQINGDTKVHAVYGEPEDLAAVKYLANYPELKGLVDKPKQEYVQSSIPNNNTVSAATYSASGFAEIPDSYEYEFKGWTKDKLDADALKGKTEKELKTILLKEGDPFQVDKQLIDEDGKPTPNLLYAYWERKPTVTLTIRNVIKGTMANAADQFEYTVAMTRPGESAGTPPVVTEFRLDGQTDTTWTGDTIPVGAKVKVVMTKENPNYTSSAKKEPGEESYTEAQDGTVTVAEFEMKENTTLTFTHELDAVTPTGIVKDNLPFLLMLLAAGGMGAYFLLGRRRRDEDEL